MLADFAVREWGFPQFRREGDAEVSRGTLGGQLVMVMKPQTYMNRSGLALRPLLAVVDFAPERDLIVLVDDVAIPLGTIRLRARGSSGGHRGLDSIEEVLGSQAYARMRIGTGPPPPGRDLASFDLEEFTPAERERLWDIMPRMLDALTCWVTEGIETAMNRYNRKPEVEP
jgi:PTH1 family peptidyl-tRNA hydrolase